MIGPELELSLGVPVTLENDVNLAAIGEQSRGVAQGVEDFVFLSVGTGLGAGLMLRGELHRGHHGAAGEVDYALGEGHYEQRADDPAATGVSAYAEALAAEGRLATRLAPPYDARAIFGAARAGDELALAVVAEEARRIARHVVPIAAVADVELVVLGGGIGVNGDLLLAPIRELLGAALPLPAARRGLQPGRRRGADWRARVRAAVGAGQRLHPPQPHRPRVNRPTIQGRAAVAAFAGPRVAAARDRRCARLSHRGRAAGRAAQAGGGDPRGRHRRRSCCSRATSCTPARPRASRRRSSRA